MSPLSYRSSLKYQREGTISEAKRKYDIPGGATIQIWAKKYGIFGVLSKKIIVQTPGEKDRILQMKAEIRRLKEALADTVLDKKIAESTLEVICENLKLDIDQVKKKAGNALQSVPSQKKKK